MYKRIFFFVIVILTAGCSSDADYELAFVSDRDGRRDIYLTNLDTTYFTNLTESDEAETGISWSPDGNMLIMTLHKRHESSIHILDLSSDRLKRASEFSSRENSAHFSPDGEKIVFISYKDQPLGEIYIMNSDGSGVKRITNNEFKESSPSFSPGGKKILFSRGIPNPHKKLLIGNSDIVERDLETEEEKVLTTSPEFETLPSYSPDGSRIAFHSCADKSCGIMIMNADGSGLKKITDDGTDCRWPAWSPDGKYIAYTKVVGDHTDIWIMEPDGSGKRALISSPYRDETAAWRPLK